MSDQLLCCVWVGYRVVLRVGTAQPGSASARYLVLVPGTLAGVWVVFECTHRSRHPHLEERAAGETARPTGRKGCPPRARFGNLVDELSTERFTKRHRDSPAEIALNAGSWSASSPPTASSVVRPPGGLRAEATLGVDGGELNSVSDAAPANAPLASDSDRLPERFLRGS